MLSCVEYILAANPMHLSFFASPMVGIRVHDTGSRHVYIKVLYTSFTRIAFPVVIIEMTGATPYFRLAGKTAPPT